MENPIDHRDLEGVVVKLVDSSAVAQAKPSRSGFSPFERQTSFLIFKNCVVLPVIVNEFEFVYLVRLSVFHGPSPAAIVQAARGRASASSESGNGGRVVLPLSGNRAVTCTTSSSRKVVTLPCARAARRSMLVLRDNISKTNPRTPRIIACS